MKKSLLALLVTAGLVSASWAQTTIINTDFSSSDSPGYSDADIVGQNGWTVAPNTGANAFNIIDAASNGSADTASAAGNFDTNTGNYAYLNSVSVGNATDTEWNGSMDFTVSVSTNTYGAADVFRIGTSSAIGSTTGLVGTISSDVFLRVGRAANGRLRIRTHDAAGGSVTLIETVDNTVVGWDAPAGDKVSDPLRLVWNVRKTRDSGYYRVAASLENLNPSNTSSTATSTVYIQKPTAYAAFSSSFVMGHAVGGAYNKTASSFDSADITIDNLSFIETNNVNPVLQKPVVGVAEGDTIVNLSWNNVGEAQEYEVKRSITGIGGTYVTQVLGLTTNGWQDTGLTNGDDYYYIVTAKATDAADVDSDPVLGAPFVPVTGTFLDTSFLASETPAYAAGDLAGQDKWKAIAVTDPAAFNVDITGNGYAATSASNGSTNGAQVFYNKPTSNGVGHVWSGTLDFSVTAAPAAGEYVTNIYTDVVTSNSVTNIQQVANLTGNNVLLFGITSDEDTNLQPKGDGDTLIIAKYTGTGDMAFGLNQYNATANLMLTIPRAALGWDPQWQDQPASNGPIFETNPISVDWTIRKTTTTNTYNASLVATIGTNTYTSIIEYTDAGDTKNQPVDAYVADLVRFAMGTEVKSADEQVYVSVDAISATHTNASTIPLGAPSGLAGVLGNLEINLTWDAGGEQDSFNVYRSEVQGGPYTNIAAGVTSQSYTDTGLTDLRTYFYVVTAVYGASESNDSDELIIRALGINNPLSWGLSSDINSSGSDQDLTGMTPVVGGPYNYYSGTGIDNSIVSVADLAWYNTNAAPVVHGIVQQAADGGTKYFKVRNGTPTDTLRAKVDDGSSNTPGSKMFWVEGAGLDAAGQTISLEMGPASWNGTARAIIRNGTTWYASESVLPGSGTFALTDLKGESWAEFTPALSTDSNLVAVTNSFVPGVALGLTDVNATGFLSVGDNHVARNFNYWKLNVGTQPSTYDLWTDSVGLYNEDAAKTTDFDGDGWNNVWEWGLGGDPTTEGSPKPIQARESYLDGSGNFVYIYPRLKDAARPNYFLTETDDLVFGSFTDQESSYTITSGGSWTNKPNFEAVTNIIPTLDSTKFIQLNIE